MKLHILELYESERDVEGHNLKFINLHSFENGLKTARHCLHTFLKALKKYQITSETFI